MLKAKAIKVIVVNKYFSTTWSLSAKSSNAIAAAQLPYCAVSLTQVHFLPLSAHMWTFYLTLPIPNSERRRRSESQ